MLFTILFEKFRLLLLVVFLKKCNKEEAFFHCSRHKIFCRFQKLFRRFAALFFLKYFFSCTGAISRTTLRAVLCDGLCDAMDCAVRWAVLCDESCSAMGCALR